MKFTVNSQDLAKQLRLLVKIVSSKPTMPVLSYMRVEASDRLTMTTTDIDVTLTMSCDALIEEVGTTLLPAVKLLAMAEQFPDADVVIADDGAKTGISCGQFASKVQTLRPEAFPDLPTMPADGLSLDGPTLAAMIGRTRHAITSTAAKHVLQGALLALSGPAMAMVTLDGKRLALTTAGREAGDGKAGADVSVVIPVKALDVLASLLDGDVQMVATDQHLFFRVGEKVLASRVIDGKFPEYDRIVPKANDKVATVDRRQLTAALRRVNVAADTNGAVYMTFGNGSLLLSSASAEVGTADELVAAEYAGELLRLCIGGDFVLDFLEAASEPAVKFHLKGASSPVLVTDGDDFLSVIMPMRSK